MSGVASTTPPAANALQPIDDAFKKWDGLALLRQKKQKRFGFFTTLLGPVAVLLLTVQILAFPHASPVALTLIAAELLALMIVLSYGFFNIGSPDEWMRYRLRAEVLRREKFLVKARVGPYLNESNPANALMRRLVVIEDLEPASLISLTDREGRTWRGLLEDARADGTTTASPDPDGFEFFYVERLLDQKVWYAGKGKKVGRLDERFEELAKGVLVGALVVAAWHLASLYFGTHTEGTERSTSQLVTEILAIVLPPVGAAATGMQSLLDVRRLSRSYADRALMLTGLADAFLKLQPQFTTGGPPRPEDEFQFKRLVIRTEEALANELLQWWLLRHSGQPT